MAKSDKRSKKTVVVPLGEKYIKALDEIAQREDTTRGELITLYLHRAIKKAADDRKQKKEKKQAQKCRDQELAAPVYAPAE